MKISRIRISVVIGLALCSTLTIAYGQALPGGEYLQQCGYTAMEGTTLIAQCVVPEGMFEMPVIQLMRLENAAGCANVAVINNQLVCTSYAK